MNNDKKAEAMIYVIGMVVILFIVCFMEIHSSHEKNHRLQRDLTYFESTYIRKQGWTMLWNGATNGVNYDLRSFDQGKTWYAVHQGKDDTLIIDGFAESVYPGLMKTLQDWDNIVAYAEKNGPINPNNLNDLKVLTNNGFSVTRKMN